MSATTYREREVILRERAAWVACDLEFCREDGREAMRAQSERMAAERYPLPKIERPRVVVDPMTSKWKWRCVDGQIQAAYTASGEWSGDQVWIVTPDRVALWADLLATPVELVDEDSLSSSEGVERREDKV